MSAMTELATYGVSMREWLIRKRQPIIAACIALVVIVGAVIWWAAGQEASIESQEHKIRVKTAEPAELDSRLYVPDTTPAPAILLAHGFGGTKDTVSEQAEKLATAGYVVLTYTARGFGESTGLIHLNAPEYEVADASALIDFLAERDEVTQDSNDDPRVAVLGGSYGGALSLLAAGYDDRIDTIVPQNTWNNLGDALFPNSLAEQHTDGVFKSAWTGLFFAAGLAAGAGPGMSLPDGYNPACGRWAPEVCDMYERIAASGRLDARARELLDESSPSSILDQITAPTLLIQGQSDTLFGLDQANANAEGITGATVKVAWYTGGHDATGTPSDQDRIDALTLNWLDYYLRGVGDEPDDTFTYSRMGGINSRRADVATVGMTAPQYPGIEGDEAPTSLELTAVPQTIASPPGGIPAPISSVPSFGQLAALAGNGIIQEIPGQFAAFETDTVDEKTDIVGAPEVAIKAASPNGEAVLFLKLYDVAPTGEQTLPNSLIAPIRLTDLPATIDDAEAVTVQLPGIVHRLESGHKLRLVIATADQSYTGPINPIDYTVTVDGALTLPHVDASPLPSQESAWLMALIVLLVGLPIGAVAAWIIARIRHGRRDRSVIADIEETPLVVNDLRKVYKDGYVAVDGVSYTVERGQVVGLLGPNGAGKTTSLRVLMGLLQPTSGSMRVFGREVTPGAPVLSRLGALVEGPGLLPHLSGIDNLKLYWRSTGRPEADAQFARVIEIADLGDRINRKVRTYSHGMKQRIAIAQAMLGMPELLVLDEPTDGLDPPQIAEMRRVLHHYAEGGRAVLVSSHLLAEVEQTCSHVVVMSRGKVVGAGEVSEVIGGRDGQRLEDAFLELVEQ